MVSDQSHLAPPVTPEPRKTRSTRGPQGTPASHDHRRGAPALVDPDKGRMDLIDLLDLRDAIEHRANRVRVTALERRVLSAVLRQTVRRGRLADSMSHDYLARFADTHPKEVGNALRALAKCGLVRYTPGDTVARTGGEGYRRTFSRIGVIIPPQWERFRDDGWDPEPVDLAGVKGEGKTFSQGEGKTFSQGKGNTFPLGGWCRTGLPGVCRANLEAR